MAFLVQKQYFALELWRHA